MLIFFIIFWFALLAGGQDYDIAQWQITIRNPANSNHDIPIHILSPITDATDTNKFGLFLYMHGDPCEWWWYEYLALYIVPNGYVAGLMASYEPAGSPARMSVDMRYSLDFIYNQSMTNSSFLLYNKLNYKSVAAGHSAGSDASLLTMGSFTQPFTYQFDGIFAEAALVNIGIRRAIAESTSKPKVFLLSGSSDCICPPIGAIPIYEELSDDVCNCKYFSIITNGTHCHFADIYVIDNICYSVEESTCTPNQKNRTIVPREIQLDLSKNYLLQFMKAVTSDEDGSEQQQKDFDALHQEMVAQEQAGYMMNISYSCRV